MTCVPTVSPQSPPLELNGSGGPPPPPEAGESSAARAAVERHITAQLAAPAVIFGEEVSHRVELDLLCVAPAPGREFWTITTSGMSARPMTVEPYSDRYMYAELILCLPPDWPLGLAAFRQERHYWPLRLLKHMARLPHLQSTWLGRGNVVRRGEGPVEAYAEGTPFSACIIRQPQLFPDKFSRFQLSSHEVAIHAICPIYREEAEFKIRKSSDALFKLLDKAGVTELIDNQRANTCPRRESAANGGLFAEWT